MPILELASSMFSSRCVLGRRILLIVPGVLSDPSCNLCSFDVDRLQLWLSTYSRRSLLVVL